MCHFSFLIQTYKIQAKNWYDIKDIFSKKNDETQEIKEPRTRSQFVNDNDREKQLLMEEMLDLDNEDSFNIERHVTFED